MHSLFFRFVVVFWLRSNFGEDVYTYLFWILLPDIHTNINKQNISNEPSCTIKVSQTTKDNNTWNNTDTCIITLANITKTVVLLFNFFPASFYFVAWM